MNNIFQGWSLIGCIIGISLIRGEVRWTEIMDLQSCGLLTELGEIFFCASLEI